MRQQLLSVAAIAAICYEANAAYCRSIGDFSQPSWEDAPEWQRSSVLTGVMKILSGEVTTPEQSHESWMAQKLAEGWVYGPTKDAEAKTHPCMVPYDQLPEEQRTKDTIFHGIVKSLSVPATGDRFAEPGQMHHADGWYFRRMEDRSVRIQKRGGAIHEVVEAEHLIPGAEWGSIVQHVGAAE